MTNRKTTPTPFNKKLVLNQYILSLFDVKDFRRLASYIDNLRFEEISEDKVSQFCQHLPNAFGSNAVIDVDTLRQYDANITAHTKKMKNSEGAPIKWKYFQYLALLFTEIYLDRYFNHREELIVALNAYLPRINNNLPPKEQLSEFTEDDLRRIAFWSATGSGKTLIMHMNIRQMQHYLKKEKREGDFNRILLVTPNAGLSKQHLKEMEYSGIEAAIFSKNIAPMLKDEVIIIEITKFEGKDGKETVSVDSFEQNNFVLIDEGHRGSSGDKWSEHRRKLAKKGFAIEYSATLGQAAANKNKPEIAKSYAKSILFDYSYQHFYRDGYGKDCRIFNLRESQDDEMQELYLTAYMLSFYQQKKLFADDKARAQEFNIESPLCVFVGNSVNATKTQRDREMSDVLNILLFLSQLTSPNNKSTVIKRIEQIVNGTSPLMKATRAHIFNNAFTHLIGVAPTEIYNDMLQKVFNASTGAALHIDELKGADGEIALSLGTNNKDFGVINVGEANKFCNLCDKQEELVVSSRNFTGSLFQNINTPNSNLHMLIGSKRFSEGWNSWRVSTMGMMNVGKSEGSQVIQLFGRGVRLRGYNRCLKRHTFVQHDYNPSKNDKLAVLETLNIFGVDADYMDQFKEYLKNEGVPTGAMVEISVPAIKQLKNKNLKIIKIPKGLDYQKKGGRLILAPPPEDLKFSKVTLDYYPQIQFEAAADLNDESPPTDKDTAWLSEQHLSMLNYDELYFDLQEFKKERGWYNLVISKNAVKSILRDESWYELLISKERLAFTNYEQVNMWQDIASTLMKKYCERFYQISRSEWEAPHREYKLLQEDDANFIKEHKFVVEESHKGLIKHIKGLRDTIKTRKTNLPTENIEFDASVAIFFNRHLYQPLIESGNKNLRVQPVALNEDEGKFIERLKLYLQGEDLAGKELYLLRNQTKGKGVGFFEAGNFYPDFILWLVEGNMQRIAFIDPKGLRMLDSSDPRLHFHSEIKAIEAQMADKDVKLYSFIISVNKYSDINKRYEWSKAKFNDKNILFQDDSNYIEDMMNKIMV